MKKVFIFVSLMVAAVMLLTACGPAPTEAPTVVPPTQEPTPVPPTATPVPGIGSGEHPIKVLFVPSVDVNKIVTGGQKVAQALHDATGLAFDVKVPTSYTATIEEMCASPTDTIAFIAPLAYVIANQECGADVAFKASRYGVPVYWAAYIVLRDSPYQTLEDLQGKTWGYGEPTSASGYMLPLADLKNKGIVVGNKVETGGHNQTVAAVYNGTVDFGTVFYNAPLKPDGTVAWTYDDYLAGTVTPDMYDVPAESVPNCAVTADTKSISCDGWIVTDARANIRIASPDVIQKVRILALSQEVPNDTMSFSSEFPAELRAQIEAAMVAFSGTPGWNASIGSKDFYNWTGLIPATDAEYDIVRAMVAETGYTIK
jgi:phosphonate transport system substrate-binding protein